MDSSTPATRFTRVRRVCLSVLGVVVALFASQLAAQWLTPFFRSVVGGFLPGFGNYRDLLLTLLVGGCVILLGWRKETGMCLPTSSRSFVALAIAVCYLTAVTACFKGFSVSNATFHLVCFILLDELFNAAWEEIFFRGFALRLLQPCGVVGSIIVSSLIFCLIHNLGSDALNFYQYLSLLFAYGLIFCASRLQTDSLVPAIVAHCLINSQSHILRASSEGVDETHFHIIVALLMPLPLLVYGFVTIWKNHAEWEERLAAGQAATEADAPALQSHSQEQLSEPSATKERSP